MKNPLFAFSACLRHAFMTGVGYDDFSRIDETDQRRWADYDPPETGAFATMAAILAGDRIEVNGEPPKSMILHPNVFGRFSTGLSHDAERLVKIIWGENAAHTGCDWGKVITGEHTPPSPSPDMLNVWHLIPTPSVSLRDLGKDLEYMWKDIINAIPKGSIWQHKENEAFYRVEGVTLNCITDEWDVLYVPLYRCKIDSFTRQAVNHPKAFAARFVMADKGTDYANGRLYPQIFSQPPKEKEVEE